MTGTATALVLLSAGGHAYWNYLLKRAGGTQVVIGLSKLVEAAMFLPPLVVFLVLQRSAHGTLAMWAGVGAMLVLVNYVALGMAYTRGDLSLVYPLARGAILVFLPLLGFLLLGERIDAVGAAGIVTILAGIVLLHGRARGNSQTAGVAPLPRSVILLALLAAFSAACYTLWDKAAVQRLPAVAYFAGYTVILGICYAGWLLQRAERQDIRAAWRSQRAPIVLIAVGNSLSYLLVLAALRIEVSSYVIALRQLSVGIGALLGWRLLREQLGWRRAAGIALLMLGCAAVAVPR